MSTEDSLDHSGSPPPQAEDTNIHQVRSEHEAQIEKTNRRDNVEPEFTEFRKKSELHLRQVGDMKKKITMLTTRFDKFNYEIEKIRNQWTEMEREKDILTATKERFKREMHAMEKVVRKDNRTAKRYRDYLELAQEVLVLDDSDDDEDEDSAMFDWGAHGQGGVEDEDEHVQ